MCGSCFTRKEGNVMKLTMLGTGNALVYHCYNTCFVLSDEQGHFMVDGGGGSAVLVQLKKAGIPLKDIHDIFVTHKHVDHLLGVIWLVRVICHGYNSNPDRPDTRIYGHDEVLGLVREISGKLLTKKETAWFDKKMHFIEVTDGEEREIIGHRICFFDIQSTKAKQFGFTLYMEDGRKLTCCGDEPFNEYAREYAKDSDWLLHEAFCLYSQADRFQPYEKHHSTVKDACMLAEDLGVKNLLLYHTEDANFDRRQELYTREGEEYFSGNLLVPYDLDEIELI